MFRNPRIVQEASLDHVSGEGQRQRRIIWPDGNELSHRPEGEPQWNLWRLVIEYGLQHGNPDIVSAADAQRQLLAKFRSGLCRARGSDPDGVCRDMQPGEWRGLMLDDLKGPPRLESKRSGHSSSAWHNVTVPRDAMVRHWPERIAPSRAFVDAETAMRRIVSQVPKPKYPEAIRLCMSAANCTRDVAAAVKVAVQGGSGAALAASVAAVEGSCGRVQVPNKIRYDDPFGTDKVDSLRKMAAAA